MKIVILFFIIFSSSMASSAELISLKAYLKQELAGAAKISKESFKLSPKQKKKMQALAPDANDSSFSFYYARNKASELLKACIVVPQEGKEGHMKIGVCFDKSALVTNVRILSSEEERGRQVEEESFLKQFRGKKISDRFHVGKDVDAVSGATYSSNSVAEAIRKASYAFKTFIKEKK